MQLILSTFTGIGLLDKAFKEKGFCVVSAGDLITGQDIREFKGVKGKFEGGIGGSPCPDFSGLKRVKGTYSLEMVYEFLRVMAECEPNWFLHENVKGVPNLTDLLNAKESPLSKENTEILTEYSYQRIDINQGWYEDISRLRHIQFASKEGVYLDIPRGKMIGAKDKCVLATDRRNFKELCCLQGLNKDYDLPDFNLAGKKRAVGNGVPLSIGRVLAEAVLNATEKLQSNNNRCLCGCKRILIGRKKYYDFSCRKRAERKRKKMDKSNIVKSNIYRCIEHCPNCPFLDNGIKINLNDGRVDGIKTMLLNDLNSSFNCHKTVYNLDNDMNETKKQDLKMCFGAYEFLKKNNKENLQMQLAKRLNIEKE